MKFPLFLMYLMIGLGASVQMRVDKPDLAEGELVTAMLVWPVFVGARLAAVEDQPEQEKTMNDRDNAIRVLDDQVGKSDEASERETLRKAAEILRRRQQTTTRGPADAGSPMDDKLTR